MAQQYSLRWNNHQPNFISMFTTLLNTQTLVDVTLAAEGKHLQAHKVVLSACSTYFQALFVDNPSRHPIVILKDVTFADLRTMVDFMYYGEVNVTEEQLPKVLDTAKLLKIKGLTEMPDSTSLTRAQGGAGGGPAADFHSPAEPADPQRMSSSPASSPSIKRRRRRKSSTGSTSLHVVGEEAREEPAAELARDGGGGGGGGVTLSSVPARRRDIFDDRHHDASHQTPDNPHNLNMDTLGVDNPTVMAQAIKKPDVAVGSAETFAAGLKLRRSTHFKRQHRVPEDGGGEGVHRQASEPCAALPPLPALRKYDSYPQYTTKTRRMKSEEHDVGPMLIRTVTVIEQPAPGAGAGGGEAAPRASHTPAVRSGPPLSCNFCWNTVDDCGRILRRKTQYHCPECRTNLCIVPCFHEYHDTEPAAAAHHLRLGPATSHHQ